MDVNSLNARKQMDFFGPITKLSHLYILPDDVLNILLVNYCFLSEGSSYCKSQRKSPHWVGDSLDVKIT